jgi:hypothetical protein
MNGSVYKRAFMIYNLLYVLETGEKQKQGAK